MLCSLLRVRKRGRRFYELQPDGTLRPSWHGAFRGWFSTLSQEEVTPFPNAHPEFIREDSVIKRLTRHLAITQDAALGPSQRLYL